MAFSPLSSHLGPELQPNRCQNSAESNWSEENRHLQDCWQSLPPSKSSPAFPNLKIAFPNMLFMNCHPLCLFKLIFTQKRMLYSFPSSWLCVCRTVPLTLLMVLMGYSCQVLHMMVKYNDSRSQEEADRKSWNSYWSPGKEEIKVFFSSGCKV